MDDSDSVLTLLTYNGVQAAADLVAELLEDRNLDLPHSIDEAYSDETRAAMGAMIMERNESNDEGPGDDYAVEDNIIS